MLTSPCMFMLKDKETVYGVVSNSFSTTCRPFLASSCFDAGWEKGQKELNVFSRHDNLFSREHRDK